MIKDKRKLRDYLASSIGILTAIASAWMTIDWINFDVSKEWPKLVLSAIIAIGGITSRVKSID